MPHYKRPMGVCNKQEPGVCPGIEVQQHLGCVSEWVQGSDCLSFSALIRLYLKYCFEPSSRKHQWHYLWKSKAENVSKKETEEQGLLSSVRSSSKDRARLFTVVNAGSTRDNGLKLRVERFRLGIMRSFCTMRTVRACPERCYHLHPRRFPSPDWVIS